MNANARRLLILLSAFICVHLRLLTLHVNAEPPLALRDVGESSDAQTIEFRGLRAGAFDPKLWQRGKLHLVRDTRSPLLEPRDGAFRNIYAPSIVKRARDWAVFYGGWDGATAGNDRIYRTDTPDFITFGERRTVIEHGEFRHVCNVSAVAGDGGDFKMLCTLYPDRRGRNKPAFFHLKDATAPSIATANDIITMKGYDRFDDADINGMNVLLREDGKYRMYFNNFRDGGKTFRATSDDGKHFGFDGVALAPSAIVNDVKRFDVIGGGSWYLMALHANADRLFFALSRNGRGFAQMQTLTTANSDEDRFMVAVGWVVDERRVLGLLYGAGAAASLDRNRIFALWLQKKIVLDGEDELRALGPDRQTLTTTKAYTGGLKLFAEDGQTPLGAIDKVELSAGRAYEITR